MANPGSSLGFGSNGSDLITVVAVGPGNPDMLTLQGRDALLKADLVIGFQTVLNVVRPWLGNSEVRPMTYRDQEEVLQYAEGQSQRGRNCVVCCWGDLTVSASELLARVRRRAHNVELINGVSSIQVALSRAEISLEDAVFVTLHKRSDTTSDVEELAHYLKEGRRHIVLLPRPYDLMPAEIATALLDSGVGAEVPVTVYQRLTLADEQCWTGSLRNCSEVEEDFSDLSIMVFRRC